VFGLLEAVLVGALGLGSLLAPLAVAGLGTRGALYAAGTLLPVLAIVSRRALHRVDAGARVPEEQLAAIRSVPFLDVLPLQRKEALAAALERLDLPPGHTLFHRGDRGDRLYLLAEGTVEVDLEDGTKTEQAPAFVGELALLRNAARSATVRTGTAATLWTLDGEAFVAAVSGHERSRSGADAVVASRGVVYGV
jgi:hypothetical protein